MRHYNRPVPLAAFRLSAQRPIPIESNTDSPDELTRRLPRGFYSTFITNANGTRVLGLSAHLDRIYAPIESSLTPSASRADLRLALSRLAASNAPGESRFRVLLSESDGTVYVIVQPFAPLAKEIYERGVRVITANLVRREARKKDSDFIAASQAERAKIGGGVFEVLLTKDGKIYEGMTSNFYAIPQNSFCFSQGRRNEFRGTLITARRGILLGVTRRAVLRLARGEGMGIEYRAPRLDEDFAEAFLTSSSRGIVPIVKIDGRSVGEGRVGAWTKRLSSAYRAYVEERSEELVG